MRYKSKRFVQLINKNIAYAPRRDCQFAVIAFPTDRSFCKVLSWHTTAEAAEKQFLKVRQHTPAAIQHALTTWFEWPEEGVNTCRECGCKYWDGPFCHECGTLYRSESVMTGA